MKLLGSILVAALALSACGRDEARRGVPVSHGDAAAILESTPWLDRAPERESDVVHVWVFPRGEGLYFVGNSYKGAYETFRYFVEDDELRVRFHDDGRGGKTYTMHFRIERIEDRVFDYRLTFDQSPRGPKVYYGLDQRHGAAAPGAMRRLLDSLPR
jgi:hypothetical protein